MKMGYGKLCELLGLDSEVQTKIQMLQQCSNAESNPVPSRELSKLLLAQQQRRPRSVEVVANSLGRLTGDLAVFFCAAKLWRLERKRKALVWSPCVRRERAS